MKITNETTTLQVAELIGEFADELDGRIALGLLSKDMVVDTDEVDFLDLFDRVCAERVKMTIGSN